MSFKVGDQVQFQVWNQDINSILGDGQAFMLTGGEVRALWHLSGNVGFQSLFGSSLNNVHTTKTCDMYTQHKLILQSQLQNQLTSHFCSEGIHSVL